MSPDLRSSFNDCLQVPLGDKDCNDSNLMEDDDDNSVDAESMRRRLARKETAAVRYLRVLVVVILVVAMLIVSLNTYFVMKHQERENFESSFDDYVDQIFTVFRKGAQDRLQAIASFSTEMTSYAHDHNLTWPYVSLSNFEVRAAGVRSMADALFLFVLPLVTNETLLEYEHFVLQNYEEWVSESLAIREDFGATDLVSLEFEEYRRKQRQRQLNYMPDFSTGFSSEVFSFHPTQANALVDAQGEGPFFPVWQHSPPNKITINANVYTYPVLSKGLARLQQCKQAVMGSVNRYKSAGLTSTIFYPIFDNFYRDTLVGSLLLDIRWPSFFSGILPPNAIGLDCVVQNTCGQAFTFQVNGEEFVFIGDGDQHDPAYDHMGQSVTLALDPQSAGYSGVAVDDGYCQYTLSVYPSDQLKQVFITQEPVVYMVAALGIFGFLAVVFLIYNGLVERRQRLVMTTAIRSNVIASSVFPKSFRERIYKEGETRRLKQRQISSSTFSPNANLYPETTILFADIPGFDAWSAQREPAHVFILLETLYGAFDSLAKKRNVFKVETVADCYVAVAGLPKPDPKHAATMVTFASECIAQMNGILKCLEASLGPDTADLSWRVGVHSGPVTAGVLRGGKARFQLFGDTMNMSARIKSHSTMNSIHASQATAEALKSLGLGHWVTPREQTVYAKGKGDLHTFWIDPNSHPRGDSHPRRSTMSLVRVGGSNRNLHSSAIVGWADASLECGGGEEEEEKASYDKTQRLIEWNADLLGKLLKEILARRSLRPPNSSFQDTWLETLETSSDLASFSEDDPFENNSVSAVEEEDPFLVGEEPVRDEPVPPRTVSSVSETSNGDYTPEDLALAKDPFETNVSRFIDELNRDFLETSRQISERFELGCPTDASAPTSLGATTTSAEETATNEDASDSYHLTISDEDPGQDVSNMINELARDFAQTNDNISKMFQADAEDPQVHFPIESANADCLQVPIESGNVCVDTANVETANTVEVDFSSDSEASQDDPSSGVASLMDELARGLEDTPENQIQEPPVENPTRHEPVIYRDELSEIIALPRFDAEIAAKQVDPDSIDLGEAVEDQLKRYVSRIASLYRDNPFHNFEHASHVTMSVNKLLKRVAAGDNLARAKSGVDNIGESDLHDYTFGITSDPLTQFAVLFSALVHDVDHRGVTNYQLVQEKSDIAARFQNQSVLEQNSIDIAWTILMEPQFSDLRKCIFQTESESTRFRKLVVNIVLATDIFDKDMSSLRKERWDRAFHGPQEEDQNVDRMATIVIEHIMQASDVAHTMQHFSTYLKWNRRLFKEMYQAYVDDRLDKDPTEGWYSGELWFFDNYVIPLAKKIQECRVFGVASDECLQHAMENRQKWEQEGKELLKEMISSVQTTVYI